MNRAPSTKVIYRTITRLIRTVVKACRSIPTRLRQWYDAKMAEHFSCAKNWIQDRYHLRCDAEIRIKYLWLDATRAVARQDFREYERIRAEMRKAIRGN